MVWFGDTLLYCALQAAQRSVRIVEHKESTMQGRSASCGGCRGSIWTGTMIEIWVPNEAADPSRMDR